MSLLHRFAVGRPAKGTDPIMGSALVADGNLSADAGIAGPVCRDLPTRRTTGRPGPLLAFLRRRVAGSPAPIQRVR